MQLVHQLNSLIIIFVLVPFFQQLKKKKMKFDSGETPSEDGSIVSDTVTKKKATAIKEKPKKKKGEDVSPFVLRKRMQQLYKAVQGYQVGEFAFLSSSFFMFVLIMSTILFSFYSCFYCVHSHS